MNFIDYEKLNHRNNNKEHSPLRVPKGLILIMSEENQVFNPDNFNRMLIGDFNLTENKDEYSESNCKMLNEAVYNKFYDIMLANKRKPYVTRKNKGSQNKPKNKKPKNKTRNGKNNKKT